MMSEWARTLALLEGAAWLAFGLGTFALTIGLIQFVVSWVYRRLTNKL